MSQGCWKINEGSFLYQITFIYYTCFLLKTQTPHWSLVPGLERCMAAIGRVMSQSSAGCGGWVDLQGLTQVSEPLGKGSTLGLSSEATSALGHC